MSNPFRPTYRQLDEAEQEHIEQIKDSALALHLLIERISYQRDSRDVARYQALAKTALEEAVMWATKAVST